MTRCGGGAAYELGEADCVAAGGGGAWIAAEVAPGVPWLGMFLPYAPVHHLLLAESELRRW